VPVFEHIVHPLKAAVFWLGDIIIFQAASSDVLCKQLHIWQDWCIMREVVTRRTAGTFL
jgi:hypothetical protein